MPQNKEANVLSHHGTLCHDMLYVTTIVASLYKPALTTQSGNHLSWICSTCHEVGSFSFFCGERNINLCNSYYFSTTGIQYTL